MATSALQRTQVEQILFDLWLPAVRARQFLSEVAQRARSLKCTNMQNGETTRLSSSKSRMSLWREGLREQTCATRVVRTGSELSNEMATNE
jgi:hypothetical protein